MLGSYDLGKEKESYNLVGLYFIEDEKNLARCSRKSLTTLQAVKLESEV